MKVVEYRLNRLEQPVFMAVPKPMLTEFGIHHRLQTISQNRGTCSCWIGKKTVIQIHFVSLLDTAVIFQMAHYDFICFAVRHFRGSLDVAKKQYVTTHQIQEEKKEKRAPRHPTLHCLAKFNAKSGRCQDFFNHKFLGSKGFRKFLALNFAFLFITRSFLGKSIFRFFNLSKEEIDMDVTYLYIPIERILRFAIDLLTQAQKCLRPQLSTDNKQL